MMVQSRIGVQIPIPRLATKLYPPPSVPGHRPLTTDHRPLQSPKSAPTVPCKRLRNVLYCKVEPEPNPGWIRTRCMRTTARIPFTGRPPCRPALNYTSQTCTQRTSHRSLQVPTESAHTCRPPRRQYTVERNPPCHPCPRRRHPALYPVTKSMQLSLFCALSAPKRHFLRTFCPKPTAY